MKEIKKEESWRTMAIIEKKTKTHEPNIYSQKFATTNQSNPPMAMDFLDVLSQYQTAIANMLEALARNHQRIQDELKAH